VTYREINGVRNKKEKRKRKEGESEGKKRMGKRKTE
jgi:hypothetical protein